MYNELAFYPTQRSEMLRFQHARGRVSLASRCAITVILLAVFSLTVSLATRFSAVSARAGQGTSVSAQSLEGKTQRLLIKALQLSAPVARFTLFEPPRSSSFLASAVFPFTTFSSEIWLYDRPPPSYLSDIS
jgi:hypothetical protein